MIRQPLGVCAIIAPFNFPGMIPFWFLPYAIACGNTVVLKPSERVPLTMQKVMELIDPSRCPRAWSTWSTAVEKSSTRFSIIRRSEPSALSAPARSPNTCMHAPPQRASERSVRAARRTRSSSCPMPICGRFGVIADSAFGCAGQRCLATSLAITVGERADAVREAIQEKARTRVTGYGLDEGVQMGPVISPESRPRIVSDRSRHLAKAHGRWSTVAARDPPSMRGNFVRPTVIDGLPFSSGSPGTEIFGPVLSMHHAETIDEAIALVNAGSYGNQACLFTTSGAGARKFRHEAAVGNIGINIAVAAPMAFFPFSGARESFFGDLHGQGRDAIEFFTQEKVVVERWPVDWNRRF